MKGAALGASIAVMIAAAPARADDEDDSVRDHVPAASLVVSAALADEPGVIVALMDRTVAYDLDAAACGKAYTRPGRATGAARAKLAACLIRLGKDRVLHAWPTYESEPPRVVVHLDDAVLALELVRAKGTLRVRAIELTWNEAEAEDEGDALGVPDGDIGGVEGGVAGVPLPPPPPLPQFVSGRVLEGHRTAGDSRIAIDARTRAALTEAGLTSAAATVMVCVDPEGAIIKVRVIRASGLQAFDRRVEVAIRGGWRFRPVEIRGRPKEVCGGMTVRPEEAP